MDRPARREKTRHQAVTPGPQIGLADCLVDHRPAEVLAQPYRPQAEDGVGAIARCGAGEIRAGGSEPIGEACDQIEGQERRIGGDADNEGAVRPL
jgi:hypothetical protein